MMGTLLAILTAILGVVCVLWTGRATVGKEEPFLATVLLMKQLLKHMIGQRIIFKDWRLQHTAAHAMTLITCVRH
jgi:NADH:ubiquinone oxidoreductase subunit 4 (subunit M)